MATHPGPRTLAEKVWDSHVVVPGENGKPDLLYIDLHLVHEVTSPQAFEGLRIENRPLQLLRISPHVLRLRLCAVTPLSLGCESTPLEIKNRELCMWLARSWG